MDFPSFRQKDGQSVYVNQAVSAQGFHCTYDHVPDMQLNLAKRINEEIAGCNPTYCAETISTEPLVNMHKVRLR